MHEEALLRDLRRKLEEVARETRARRITRVSIWVGALCHLTPESLKTHWQDTMVGTPASSASLSVEASQDIDDPGAESVILKSVDVEESIRGVPE